MHALTDFQNRLQKSYKHLRKWAQRQGIEAYRLYDRDIPQYPVAIDLYGQYVHIAEYDTGWQQEEEEHQAWMEDIKRTTATTLELPYEHIAFKIRQRQRGEAQYEKLASEGRTFSVQEHGRHFWVNLDSYLDTGLFLDHRITRRLVGERSAQKRMLNLFAYTGSFSVYAATGGAKETVTVDMSNTYLEWAQRNFTLNHIDTHAHQFIRADVFRYLDDAIAQRERFDLIVMDPPSFSNSSKMVSTLDVQRDHLSLILDCLELLNPHGSLYFSTNLRDFKLDASLGALCKNTTQHSIPEDFRNKRIHHSFYFEKH